MLFLKIAPSRKKHISCPNIYNILLYLEICFFRPPDRARARKKTNGLALARGRSKCVKDFAKQKA